MAPDLAPDSGRNATQNNGPARMTFRPEFFKGLAVAAAVIIVDQISKWWILGFVMQPPKVIVIVIAHLVNRATIPIQNHVVRMNNRIGSRSR